MPDFKKLYMATESLHKRIVQQDQDWSQPCHLVHLVNPVNASTSHDLARAQKFTYESMRRAVTFAKELDSAIHVDIVAAPLPEDIPAVPDCAIQLAPLTRVSADVGAFKVERRLPLAMEIIERGREYTRSKGGHQPRYLIFTNVDIGVLPHFYCYAAWLIRGGFDVSIINRRSVGGFYNKIEELGAILSDFGHTHPGLDCFIFRSDIVDQFAPFDSIIGIGHVMRPLLFNLMAFAHNPVIVTDAHATFHIGLDSEWGADKYSDYATFNRSQCLRVIEELCRRDTEMERRLSAFVSATDERLWIPEGVLGVRRRRSILSVGASVWRRLLRLLKSGR